MTRPLFLFFFFLNEVHVSSASLNSVFLIISNAATLCCFSSNESKMALTGMCLSTSFSSIDLWKPWKKCAPHCLHSGNDLVHSLGVNSHSSHAWFLHYVPQEDPGIRHPTRPHCGFASTETSHHVFTRKGQKSCFCPKKQRR